MAVAVKRYVVTGFLPGKLAHYSIHSKFFDRTAALRRRIKVNGQDRHPNPKMLRSTVLYRKTTVPLLK